MIAKEEIAIKSAEDAVLACIEQDEKENAPFSGECNRLDAKEPSELLENAAHSENVSLNTEQTQKDSANNEMPIEEPLSVLEEQPEQASSALDNSASEIMGLSALKHAENLTWVQQQVLRIEMEVSREKLAAEQQWKPIVQPRQDEFAYTFSRPETQKVPPKQKKKPSRPLSFFSCFSNPFGRRQARGGRSS